MTLAAIKDDPKFNISFVQCVQKWQCLYNHSLKEYNNKEEQDKAWRAVALEMNCPVAACKERWKNLRASLCRHLRHQANGANSKAKRPYYLAEYMQFVMPYTKIRPIKEEFSPVENNNAEDGYAEEAGDVDSGYQVDEEPYFQPDSAVIKEEIPSAFPSDFSNVFGGLPTRNGVSDAIKHKSTLDPLELCELEYSSAKRQKLEALAEDADLMFMKSLIPDMKKMSDRAKNNFKRNILGMIDEILYSNVGSSSTVTQTNHKIPPNPD